MGVEGFYYDQMVSTDHTIEDCISILVEKGLLKKGELAINIASIPMEERGPSNMLKLSYV
jgi:pyruvate kinase